MVIEIAEYVYRSNMMAVRIDGYSYQERELDTVNRVLRKAKAKYSEEELPRDSHGRMGLRYSLQGPNIQKVENYLGIKFFSKEETIGEGEAFRCERISLSNERGCKTIYANDNDAANLICAIVAKEQKWFGGVAHEGRCSH